jgi:hypothetical protein
MKSISSPTYQQNLTHYGLILSSYLVQGYPFETTIREALQRLRQDLRVKGEHALALEAEMVLIRSELVTDLSDMALIRQRVESIVAVILSIPHTSAPWLASLVSNTGVSLAVLGSTAYLAFIGLPNASRFEPMLPVVEGTLQDFEQLSGDALPKLEDSVLINYPVAMEFQLDQAGIQPRWFNQLCYHWVTLSGQNWADLSDMDRVNQADALLYRLEQGLKKERLAALGRRDDDYFQALTRQSQSMQLGQTEAYRQANALFFDLFPEFVNHQNQLPGTGFDHVWFELLAEVINSHAYPDTGDLALTFGH